MVKPVTYLEKDILEFIRQCDINKIDWRKVAYLADKETIEHFMKHNYDLYLAENKFNRQPQIITIYGMEVRQK